MCIALCFGSSKMITLKADIQYDKMKKFISIREQCAQNIKYVKYVVTGHTSLADNCIENNIFRMMQL